MALVVTFAGKAPLGADSSLQVWSYTVAGSPPDLIPGQRIAIALPADVDVRDPASYPAVPALRGMFLERSAAISRQYAGRTISPGGGQQTIAFLAPPGQADRELFVVTAQGGRPWAVQPFATSAGGTSDNVQTMASPARASGTGSGRPVGEFTGTLPYASEVFGVYQPLAGWFGNDASLRVAAALGLDVGRDAFAGDAARELAHPALAELAAQDPPTDGILSPVGLVNLFRQYFFEFDTFLGPPAGHLWLSPGGTVEVVETSTRRTLVERTAEQSEEATRRSEESLTSQDDVADAVKEENANDTKLGASVSAGGKFAGIYHADASASFSTENTTKRSSEETHKHTRTQSSKISSEIKRNFRTTFKTVTETTDTTSRRYVVQNTTGKLLNYELRRKMRKVGVQVQHIGTQLSWQVFLGPGAAQPPGAPSPGAPSRTVVAPGRLLGLGELVHVVPAPDLTSLREPVKPPKLERKEVNYTCVYNIQMFPIANNNPPHNDAFWSRIDENTGRMGRGEEDEYIVGNLQVRPSPPAPGYTLDPNTALIRFISCKSANGSDTAFDAHYSIDGTDPAAITIKCDHVSFGGTGAVTLVHSLTWNPPRVDPAQQEYEAAKKLYDEQVAELQRKAYGEAVRTRLNLVSGIRPRPAAELREEERQAVFASLIRQLRLIPSDPHLESEIIRQIFDIDQMLYFVAPDFWRPDYLADPAGPDTSGRYPVPQPVWTTTAADPLAGETVLSWYSHTGSDKLPPSAPAPPAPGEPPTPPPAQQKEWRVNYLVTENTQPAPMGSSLGWLIQADGDERRNEFLNAAWVKAVLPVRPRHELDALSWLSKANVEGEAGLGRPYPWQPGDPDEYRGKKVGEVLVLLAKELQAKNGDVAVTLATEKVFETGFDPLDGGFRPAEPYQIFDQWVEVLPTDQVVAVEVEYDPKTGQQR